MRRERLNTQSQYSDSSNLNARQQLHARFSVNQWACLRPTNALSRKYVRVPV